MENNEELNSTIDRLAAAAGRLEQLAERLTETDEATIGRIVAQIDERLEDRRESELEQKLAAAEQRIAELEVAAASATEDGCPTSRRDVGSRKTISAATSSLLAKHGVALDSIEAGTLDAALTGLSLEQRIAVKSQLLRAGLLS